MSAPFDFESLDWQKFEKLVNQVLLRVDTRIKPVNGAGGDQGIDCFIGEFSGKKEVYQHKFFCKTIGPSQRRQISNSLKTARTKHKQMSKWTLVVPKTLSPSEHTWFEEFQKKNKDVEISLMDDTRINDVLLKNKDIADKFFPISKIEREMKRMNEKWNKVTKSLKEEGDVVWKHDLAPRVKQMGICRLTIVGATSEELAKRIYVMYPNEPKSSFGITNFKLRDKERIARLIFKKGRTALQLEADADEPFYLLYPRITSVDITIRDIPDTSNACILTAYSASKSLRDFLKRTIQGSVEGNIIIKEVTLDTKMKTLVNTYAHAIDILRFDPAIMEEIKREGGKEVQQHIRRETLVGDPGLPRMTWVQNALTSIKRIKKGQVSDILFFRAKSASRFDKTHLVTFEVHHDGRIRAFFPAHKFVEQDSMKEPLREFLDKWL